jgi:hypothetical protein
MVLPTFELQLLTLTGKRLQIRPIAAPAEASALACSYLGDGWARHVEVFVRHRGQWQMVSVIGQPQRPPAKPEPTTDGEDTSAGRDDTE